MKLELTESEENQCVHTEHCCILHGCKYSAPDCPVYLGYKRQSFPCEDCGSKFPEIKYPARFLRILLSRRNKFSKMNSQPYPHQVRIQIDTSGWRLMVLDQHGNVAACFEMASDGDGLSGTTTGDIVDKMEEGFSDIAADFEVDQFTQTLNNCGNINLSDVVRKLTKITWALGRPMLPPPMNLKPLK